MYSIKCVIGILIITYIYSRNSEVGKIINYKIVVRILSSAAVQSVEILYILVKLLLCCRFYLFES